MRTKLQEIALFWRRWRHLAAPFWRSSERNRTALLLGLAMAFNLINVALTVRLNEWSRDFFNALQDRNADAFFYQLTLLFALAGTSLFLYANQRYLCKKAVLIWREWMSARYTERWLQTKTYYREIFHHRIDNPDQRIAEDLRMFPSLTVTMVFDFVDSVGSLGAFAVILWGLSANYPVFGVVIPGMMLWLALAFVIVGTWLVHLVGHPLVGLERLSQRYEANYRHRLLRVREKAKEIAAYGGEACEERAIRERFGDVFAVWLKTILKERQLNYFLQGYSQISGVVPYLIAAPKYFSGAFQMGELMQTMQAFNGVRVSLSWFILNYATLADWKATVDRLTEFDAVLAERDAKSTMNVTVSAIDELRLENLRLDLPDGTVLARIPHLVWAGGTRRALTGPSGIGKSTLLYALRGMWPFGAGRVVLPSGRCLFLSQLPYLPEGNLCEVLAYPNADMHVDAHLAAQVLRAVGLSERIPEIRRTARWEEILSPGEQQRLTLGRCWVHRPDWLFMDEALSAVDTARRKTIMTKLATDFPLLSVVSVVHDTTDTKWYDETVTWDSFAQVSPRQEATRDD